MSSRTKFIAAAAALALGIPFAAEAEEGGILGVWATRDAESHVRVERCQDSLCGTIIWLKEPTYKNGISKRDRKNRDEDLRTRALIGLRLFTGFRPTEENQWNEGTLYNPEDGNTYEPTMTLLDHDSLEVEACILFFCQAQTWRRVE